MATKEHLIDEDLGPNGSLTLASHEEVQEWVNSELAFWSWLPNSGDGALAQTKQSLVNNLANIRNVNNQCISSEGAANYASQLNSLKSAIATLRSVQNGMLSTTARAKFVELVKEEEGILPAFYCAALLMDKGVTANNPNAIRGTVTAVLFEKGIKKSARPEKKALENLRESYNSILGELRAQYEGLNDELKHVVAALAEQKLENDAENHKGLAEKKAEFDKVREAKVAEFDAVRESATEEWANIRAAFLDHMALEAPVDYWGKQELKHSKRALAFSVASGLVGLSSGVGLYVFADWLLLGEPSRWKDFPGVTLLGLPLWHIVIFTVFGSLLTWLLRVLVRLMLSEIHLATDAGERVVMAKTYQALVKEGQGPAENDRTLILQTLFRPSSTGVIKEDGAPVMPIELISKIFHRT